MIRSIDLPLLPGNSFPNNIGQTRFHKSHHFEQLEVPYLSDKERPGIGGAPIYYSRPRRYPSIYARGDVSELPTWIAFDRQMLAFDAYFQESIHEVHGYNHLVRKCRIYFYLEDGTIKVVEPKVANSGIPQGCLMARQRIRLPKSSGSDEFYDIIDFNIGKTVELHGRVFKITDCDNFTRVFLNRLGIAVPDPIAMPADPYTQRREQAKYEIQPKKPTTKTDKLGQFLAMDGKVLCFTGYWDDRLTCDGDLHLLKVLYYLADDTIEVKDVTWKGQPYTLYKRAKLPKDFLGLKEPGVDSPFTVLNVLGSGTQKGRFLADSLNCGRSQVQYYRDNDLAIGTVVNVYGRRVVLTDCDPFTREYYRVKYGLEDMTPAQRPKTKAEEAVEPLPVPELPPHNGYGTHEDSAINCRTVFPFPPIKNYTQFFQKDKCGFDSHILRFGAQLMTSTVTDSCRPFVISYYLSDDTISVYENAPVNSGYSGGMLISRRKIMKPGENPMASQPPAYYTHQDLYIGNTVCLENFNLKLVSADEYALRYMELHANEFPKSNIRLILEKLREGLRPIYKQFVAQQMTNNNLPLIPYYDFRQAIKDVLKDSITEHEIITLARHYSGDPPAEDLNCVQIQSMVQNELKRYLFNAFERLEEGFCYRDPDKTGFVTKDTAYTVLRGANLPVDRDLIQLLLDRVCDERCLVNYCRLVQFLDYKKNPAPSLQPVSIGSSVGVIARNRPPVNVDIKCVDLQSLIADIDLEKTLVDNN
ncbi:EF-hand domain-containing member C2 [Homalodisca vitripennis]|nr:EF-hand domain-containing member C2 [Homalodisca vitripennis]